MRAGVSALWLALAALPAAAQEDGTALARMTGDWTGGGWVQERGDSAQERIRCRMRNNHDATTGEITVDGTCAVPGRRLVLAGALAPEGADRVTGRWQNPEGMGSQRIRGSLSAAGFAFAVTTNDQLTGERLDRVITWTVMPDRIVVTTADAADDTPLGEIVFER
ncbi:MAG: hypothetical protein AAGE76_02665 [Pseudomonadota bacterium]